MTYFHWVEFCLLNVYHCDSKIGAARSSSKNRSAVSGLTTSALNGACFFAEPRTPKEEKLRAYASNMIDVAILDIRILRFTASCVAASVLLVAYDALFATFTDAAAEIKALRES